jgi:hypothetical protein
MVLIFFSCDVTAAGTATGSTSISLYQPTTEDVAGWSAAKGALEADIAESNIRLGLQRALAKPATSTPEIVANGAIAACGCSSPIAITLPAVGVIAA